MKLISVITIASASLILSCGGSTFSSAGNQKSAKARNAAGAGKSDDGGVGGADGSGTGNNGGNGADGSGNGNGGPNGADGGVNGNGGPNGAGGTGGNTGGDPNGAGGSGGVSWPGGAGDSWNPNDTTGSDGGVAPGPIFGGDNSAPIPQDCKNQNILVLDLKSGWWEVSGLNSTFRQHMVETLKSISCPSSEPIVEYHHILKSKRPAKFYNLDFKTYTQVWILSGTPGDKDDLDANDPGLQDVINQIKTYKPNVFIGAGFGSIVHANVFSRGLLGVDAFKAEWQSTHSLSIKGTTLNIKVETRMKPNATGNLFSGITTPLADRIFLEMSAASDELDTATPGLTIMGYCEGAKSKKTIPCVGVTHTNKVGIVLESGLQRLYTVVKNDEPAMKQYLSNIVRVLSAK